MGSEGFFSGRTRDIASCMVSNSGMLVQQGGVRVCVCVLEECGEETVKLQGKPRGREGRSGYREETISGCARE